MVIGDKVRITKGRLRGEVVTYIGTTDLNFDHRLIVRREKGGNKIMGFNQEDLNKELES